MKIKPVGESFVAEIEGIDVAAELGAAEVDTLQVAIASYAVLVFRNQNLSDEEHTRFGIPHGDPGHGEISFDQLFW